MIGTPWARITKGDSRGRELADRHYTRQTPGNPRWTRPGYNHVLFAEFGGGLALWCWWRPKWEDGRPGTSRKDGLRALECTMFRREGRTPVASELIRAAVAALDTEAAARDLHLSAAGAIEMLLTGVNARATRRRRGRRSRPGECYLRAGWRVLPGKKSARADVWLYLPWGNPLDTAREV